MRWRFKTRQKPARHMSVPSDGRLLPFRLCAQRRISCSTVRRVVEGGGGGSPRHVPVLSIISCISHRVTTPKHRLEGLLVVCGPRTQGCG